MTASIKVRSLILCEYVVEGVNKKHTLVNTYSGDILVSSFPTTIPIAFYIEIVPNLPIDGSLSIRLVQDGKDAMRGEVPVKLDGDLPTVLVIPNGQMTLPNATTLKLYVGVTGERQMKVLEKKIMLNPAVETGSA